LQSGENQLNKNLKISKTMKLEIKHLAPYLPYKILVGDGRTPFELTRSNLSNVSQYITEIYLRPLSDLTKEIEHKGEKFVPIEWFEEKYYTLDLHKQCLKLLEEDGENWINQSDYMLVQHLIEWHFDIFGLIENNLAININLIRQ
jgi:hypothetical protein